MAGIPESVNRIPFAHQGSGINVKLKFAGFRETVGRFGKGIPHNNFFITVFSQSFISEYPFECTALQIIEYTQLVN